MNALAYVIAVLNPLLMNSNDDVAVRLGPLYSLANDINALPNLPREAFKNNYYRSEDKGIYISNNLKDYLYKGRGDRDEEGLIITLNFQNSYLKPNNATPLAYLLHPIDLSEEDKRKVDEVIQTLYIDKGKVNMRTVVT